MSKLFRYLQPTFFAGLFDDPLLLIFVRPLGRSLLFDCGQMHHLAKRVLKSLDALFISHAHMDHFMGMDSFIRHSHVSPKTTPVFGPPGLARRMEAKLSSYDWNLADTFWGNLRVGEVSGDRISCTLFRGPEAFARCEDGVYQGAIYDNGYLSVDAALCDHKIGVLCYRIREHEAFLLDDGKMAREKVAKGPWLRQLERLFHTRSLSGTGIGYLHVEGGRIEPRRADDAEALYRRICRQEEPASIGYLTDISFNLDNLARVEQLLAGVTLLVCECAFLAGEKEKARSTCHLCTSDLNLILERLRPRFVLPMHLSKGYLGKSDLLFEQIQPPASVTLLRVPDRLTPRPLMACEIPQPLPVIR